MENFMLSYLPMKGLIHAKWEIDTKPSAETALGCWRFSLSVTVSTLHVTSEGGPRN